jgi:Ca2+-binding EF-hand superfamily protein
MNYDIKEDEEEIWEAFKIFDKNGDNSISGLKLFLQFL